MIAQNHRFHGRGSLRTVYTKGKTVRLPAIGLRYMQNDRRRTFRVAVVIGKAISKSAVVRNRIRRRIYEIVRRSAPAINRPHDLVFTIYKPGIEKLPPIELNSIVTQLLLQANITDETASNRA